MAERCSNPKPDCKYFGTDECILSSHHAWWPGKDYKTQIEKRFRQLPQYQEELSRCDHDTLHLTSEPPLKPSRDFMLRALQQGLESKAV